MFSTRLIRSCIPRLSSSLLPTIPKRSYTFTTLKRPSLFTSTTTLTPTSPLPTTPTSLALDLLPTSAITTHPALQSLQIRCGPRDTYSPSHFVRKRRHGFLSRVKTRKGRNLLRRRKAKGRKEMSH